MITFFRTDRNPLTAPDTSLSESPATRVLAVKGLRSIRIQVLPFQGVLVKHPPRIPLHKVQKFVNSKSDWIQQALERCRLTEQRSRAHYGSASDVKTSEIRRSLTQRLQELADLHGFSFNHVSLRDQRSRWASCSARNNISLNRKLYFLPDRLRDYVLIHELAHTVRKDHSPAFWQIVHHILGKETTRSLRRELKSFDFLFYPPPTDQAQQTSGNTLT